MSQNRVSALWNAQPFVLLDGGLATQLEAAGHSLADSLWSARLLLDEPAAVSRVHLDYLRAGADCVISASYQASIEGFERLGVSTTEAKELVSGAVRLACEARDRFWRNYVEATPAHPRLPPIVAASIGSYGAWLANGSEYRGDYGLSEQALYDFHLPRWELLRRSGADLIAFETIPSAIEAQAIRRMIVSAPQHRGWVSFSSPDGRRIADGTEFSRAERLFEDLPQVLAVGMNCTSPENIDVLCRSARGAGHKPLVVYPNSGETYESETYSWHGTPRARRLADGAKSWLEAGARFIGGCCRTTPEDIRAIRSELLSGTGDPD